MQQKLFEDSPSKLTDKQNESLYNQLIKLGDMMGDGLHHEPDGKWISKEYQKVSEALFPEIKQARLDQKKRRNIERAKLIVDYLKNQKCSCGHNLVHKKIGSLKVECVVCKSIYTVKFKRRKKP